MSVIRFLLGRVILLIDALTRPSPEARSNEEQARIDQLTKSLALYQFKACPFCVKVRRFNHKKALHIETRDAKNDVVYRKQLLEDGGKIQVPCLRITDENGQHEWLYESDQIIDYLGAIAN